MITSAIDALLRRWDEHSQRPFWRMVQLFAARIFRGGGDSDAEGLDLGVGLVLTLLAMPGGFVSLLLLNKYGTFLQWLRGITNADTLLIALPDEYFFIVLSMTVTGAAAVWRWDAIFPDRRDYMNLVPLPISTRSIFFANLVAVLLGLIAVDVNGVSCILFPAVVGATQSKFIFFVKFAVVHAIGVLLASIFAFFAVFAVLGLLMALLPPRAFRRASAYARGSRCFAPLSRCRDSSAEHRQGCRGLCRRGRSFFLPPGFWACANRGGAAPTLCSQRWQGWPCPVLRQSSALRFVPTPRDIAGTSFVSPKQPRLLLHPATSESRAWESCWIALRCALLFSEAAFVLYARRCYAVNRIA